MPLDIETKEYLDFRFQTLEDAIEDVKAIAKELDAKVQRIEITSSSAIASLRSDVNIALDKIGDLQQIAKSEGEAREKLEDDIQSSIDAIKAKYDGEIRKINEDSAARQLEQETKNNRFESVRGIIIAVGLIVASEVVLLIWNFIQFGGITGFAKFLGLTP